MASQNDVSHAEIWDDSSLVNSWNEALQEYEKYHSIHARGERVEKVLREFDEQQNDEGVKNGNEDMKMGGDEENPEFQGNPEQFQAQELRAEVEPVVPESEAQPGVDDHHKSEGTTSHTQPSGIPALPPMLVGQVHDESLKNLLMSWYYAGYYTGLYEGQQQKENKASGT